MYLSIDGVARAGAQGASAQLAQEQATAKFVLRIEQEPEFCAAILAKSGMSMAVVAIPGVAAPAPELPQLNDSQSQMPGGEVIGQVVSSEIAIDQVRQLIRCMFASTAAHL